jgi:hypothetical protein
VHSLSLQLSQIQASANYSDRSYTGINSGWRESDRVSESTDSKSGHSRFEVGDRKAKLREELAKATREFLSDGGEVNAVPTGMSSWEPGTRPPPSRPLFDSPRNERTPVHEVVASIEARRESIKTRAKPASPRTKRRRQKLIYDDFGEPLRHIWVEE